MSALDDLSERDRAVLRSLLEPSPQPDDEYAEEDAEPSTEAFVEAAALCARGVRLAEAGAHEEALRAFAAAVRCAPERAACYNDRAQLLRLMRRDEEAEADLRRALELTRGERGRRRARALCQLGVLLRRRGDADDARAAFAEAARLGCGFARRQVVELDPYAALCNRMLSQVMKRENVDV